MGLVKPGEFLRLLMKWTKSFSPFGNFTGLTNFDSTLRALHISEQEFDEIFPQLKHIKGCSEFTKVQKLIRVSAQNNNKYKIYY